MDKRHFLSFSFLLFVFSQYNVIAQTTADSIKACPVKSLPELFKKKDSVLVFKPKKNNFFLVIPIIGSQPATGFSYGFVTQYTFKGKKADDKYSSVNLGAIYTEKKQLLINVKNSVMVNHNSIFLSGDWRFYIFSQPNFGLGTDIIPPSNRYDDFDLNILKEPMDYNYLKFHQTASWEVKNNYYVGAGVHLDWYTTITDKNLNVAAGQFTNHYNYSKKYDYNENEYFVNGLSLNLLYDSRDNQINTNRGMFANINYRYNPAITKSQHASSVLFMEYRCFLPLSKKNEQHVFSLWATGQLVTTGNVPYLNLPSVGWDQRSRSGKGYTQGLFRGQKMVYLETEYRFPITCNQLISGTVFANFTSASDKDREIRLFQYVQPAAGLGLRILIDKATRTNLVFNYALGRHSKAFYLNAGESF
ncbi:BamA/TamA family outer membrane protein [Flavobacterium franklandianum]|uniref:BamA/TamA family outer membrane protein n=1 Tax=Flavobacterium franklandianum TaxID=2594430 RepID=A0A553C6I1_9FLAO|nr:BamA/TamA family outer membrane protein [Flavobacterium franklandianum]TRX16139.1 BamA/TamA family outer membrane protein [Flavobacterium franklandianum]